jgi:hypothetical protein
MARRQILHGMAAISRLGSQIEQISAALSAAGVPFALIGGLALAAHKVVRATRDVDLLAPAADACLPAARWRCAC